MGRPPVSIKQVTVSPRVSLQLEEIAEMTFQICIFTEEDVRSIVLLSVPKLRFHIRVTINKQPQIYLFIYLLSVQNPH